MPIPFVKDVSYRVDMSSLTKFFSSTKIYDEVLKYECSLSKHTHLPTRIDAQQQLSRITVENDNYRYER